MRRSDAPYLALIGQIGRSKNSKHTLIMPYIARSNNEGRLLRAKTKEASEKNSKISLTFTVRSVRASSGLYRYVGRS